MVKELIAHYILDQTDTREISGYEEWRFHKRETVPNFFIVGAPKSGTTSVYEYLKQHPNVYMSPLKEPHYFVGPAEKNALEGQGIMPVHDWDTYLSLFNGVTGEKAVGEATVFYFSTPESPAMIRSRNPDAKIIVLLRNPIDRAYSNFCHLVRTGREHISDFGLAVRKENERQARGDWQFKYYLYQSRYAEHLQRYFKFFDRKQIKVVLTEDLDCQPRQILQELFEFIGVDRHFLPAVGRRFNTTDNPREQYLRWLKESAIRLRTTQFSTRQRYVTAFFNLVRRVVSPKPRVLPLSEEARAEFSRMISPDVLKLESLLDRDLSHWLKQPQWKKVRA